MCEREKLTVKDRSKNCAVYREALTVLGGRFPFGLIWFPCNTFLLKKALRICYTYYTTFAFVFNLMIFWLNPQALCSESFSEFTWTIQIVQHTIFFLMWHLNHEYAPKLPGKRWNSVQIIIKRTSFKNQYIPGSAQNLKHERIQDSTESAYRYHHGRTTTITNKKKV